MNPNLSSLGAACCIAVISANAQPIITSPPANQTASLFADATFRVSATSTQSLSINGSSMARPLRVPPAAL